MTNIDKGNFLSWHRYFMWAWEQTLRNECGYKGYLPYYNWALWADHPAASPLLDGSDTSISGDGVYIAGRNASCVPNPNRCFVEVPPGNGGGCVASGPFKELVVILKCLYQAQNIDGSPAGRCTSDQYPLSTPPYRQTHPPTVWATTPDASDATSIHAHHQKPPTLMSPN